MHLLRGLNNREKIIIAFLILLVTMNVLTLVVSSNLREFSYDFRSLLEDRLVPESELARIQENLYKNRFALLEGITHLQTQVRKDIAANNQEIEELTNMLAGTYLTQEEALVLERYGKQLQDYREMEAKVLHLIEQDSVKVALHVFVQQNIPMFEELQDTMHQLEDIQLVIGKDLYKHASHTVQVIHLFGYLSIGMAILLTVFMLKVLRFKVK